MCLAIRYLKMLWYPCIITVTAFRPMRRSGIRMHFLRQPWYRSCWCLWSIWSSLLKWCSIHRYSFWGMIWKKQNAKKQCGCHILNFLTDSVCASCFRMWQIIWFCLWEFSLSWWCLQWQWECRIHFLITKKMQKIWCLQSISMFWNLLRMKMEMYWRRTIKTQKNSVCVLCRKKAM